MSEQTAFSTADRDKSESRTADEATNDRFARRSSTDDAQIDILQSETIDQWVTDREDANESYGYFHLYVAAQSDLTGVQRASAGRRGSNTHRRRWGALSSVWHWWDSRFERP